MSTEGQRFNLSMFDQIAKLSVSGFTVSMVMAFAGRFEIVYPWF